MPADYYQVLGVARDADESTIKRAYRQLARQHHPDVADDKDAAEHRFKEINEAYEVLSDSQKRANYDRFGHAGVNGGVGDAGFGPFGAEGFGDIFDMFFGAARGGAAQQRRNGPVRGNDLRYDVEITLEEAYTGTTRDVTYRHLVACSVCRGNGAEPGTLIVPCDRCGGSGMQRQVRQTPLGQFVTQTTCTKCAGDGQIVQTPCSVCRGRGRIEDQRTLQVRIPAGVDDGSRIKISGSGEAGVRGGPDGDLYVYLSVTPHRLFRRDGLDVMIDVPVSFPQAALGVEIKVPSLDGEVPLALAAGTQSGSQYRLRGRGMPSVRGGAKGDELVTVHVVVPTKLSKHERELLEEYARAGGNEIEEKSFFERVKDAFRAD
ncbi:MAG TPA: molecular chaperone DnaJ [Candidatus Elarobacter sp.]|jgi:molecular chaperone DnaJ|nr:molecular chaperone DnaJ [Candidatus Elarobacter sp.]